MLVWLFCFSFFEQPSSTSAAWGPAEALIEREREKKEREEERRESRSAALLSGPGKALLDTPPPCANGDESLVFQPPLLFQLDGLGGALRGVLLILMKSAIALWFIADQRRFEDQVGLFQSRACLFLVPALLESGEANDDASFFVWIATVDLHPSTVNT